MKKLDLSSFDSVCAFINEIKHSGSQLDLLVNNAGVMNCPFKETNEGFEMQFGMYFILLFFFLKRRRNCVISAFEFFFDLTFFS